ALGFEGEDGALAGGQHHYGHDAFAVDPSTVANQADVAGKAGTGLHQFGGCAGMQAEFVDNGDVLAGHGQWLSSCRATSSRWRVCTLPNACSPKWRPSFSHR